MCTQCLSWGQPGTHTQLILNRPCALTAEQTTSVSQHSQGVASSTFLLRLPFSRRCSLQSWICLHHRSFSHCRPLAVAAAQIITSSPWEALAALRRMLRERLRSQSSKAASPMLSGCRMPGRGSLEDSGLIASASEAAAVPAIKVLSPGSGGRAAKPFPSGRRAFPFPCLPFSLLFPPASAAAPAASSREAQLPQQVWAH